MSTVEELWFFATKQNNRDHRRLAESNLIRATLCAKLRVEWPTIDVASPARTQMAGEADRCRYLTGLPDRPGGKHGLQVVLVVV